MRVGNHWRREKVGSEMLLTLSLTIFLGAIFVFFSQEFVRFNKKVFSIPGVKLLLPLALASWLIEVYEDWGRWVLMRCQSLLHQVLSQIASILPFDKGALAVVHILYLFILAGLPLWSYLLWCQHTGRLHPKPFNYRLSLVLWAVAAILLTVA